MPARRLASVAALASVFLPIWPISLHSETLIQRDQFGRTERRIEVRPGKPAVVMDNHGRKLGTVGRQGNDLITRDAWGRRGNLSKTGK